MMATQEPLVISAKEAAQVLGCSVRHIERMDAAGRMPAPVRLGRLKRWHLDGLREWLKAGAPSRAIWEARKQVRR